MQVLESEIPQKQITDILISIMDNMRNDEVSAFIKDIATFTYLAEKLFVIHRKVIMLILIRYSYNIYIRNIIRIP